MSHAGVGDDSLVELVKCVREAGSALLSLWPGGRGSRDDLSVTLKGDGSPVSVADEKSNGILISGLHTLFPSDAILSEEIPANEDELRSSPRAWVIDPLDGTRSFIEGRDDFSVLVALSENGTPTVGLMYFPARELFITARKGRGATCNGVDLSVSSNESCRPQGVYVRNFEASRPELASPPMDSGLAFLCVANGSLDGVALRMSSHREWDIAAPMVAVAEAGGLVTDETGNVVQICRGHFDCRYLLASNGRVHEELIDLVRTSEERAASHGIK